MMRKIPVLIFLCFIGMLSGLLSLRADEATFFLKRDSDNFAEYLSGDAEFSQQAKEYLSKSIIAYVDGKPSAVWFSRQMTEVPFNMVSRIPDPREIRTIEAIPTIQLVEVQDDFATDACLLQISQCKQLKSVNIKGGLFSGKGIAYLRSLPNLSGLGISDVAFDYRSAYVPTGERRNEGLDIQDGLVVLLNEARLDSLSLKGAFVNDRLLKSIAEVGKIKSIFLEGKNFSTDGIKTLSQMVSLETIWLLDTDISDDELKGAFPEFEFNIQFPYRILTRAE